MKRLSRKREQRAVEQVDRAVTRYQERLRRGSIYCSEIPRAVRAVSA
jgi:hypothetical protein